MNNKSSLKALLLCITAIICAGCTVEKPESMAELTIETTAEATSPTELTTITESVHATIAEITTPEPVQTTATEIATPEPVKTTAAEITTSKPVQTTATEITAKEADDKNTDQESAEEITVYYNNTSFTFKTYERTDLPENPSELSTEELFHSFAYWGGQGYILYNYPSYMMSTIPKHNLTKDTITELFARDDFLSVALDEYEKIDYFPNIDTSSMTREEARIYSHSASQADIIIGFIEIVLADDGNFDRLSDEQKIQVLNELKNKIKAKHYDKSKPDEKEYLTPSKSPFLAYVCEQKLNGKTKWYNYIKAAGEEYEKFIIYLDSGWYGDGGF